MSFTEAVKTCFRKYANFDGRARRAEYWWFYLFYLIVVGGLYLVLVVVTVVVLGASVGLASQDSSVAAGGGALASVVSGLVSLLVLAAVLGLFLPSLAVSVRRLHDTGRSGLWVLIGFVPFGGIVLLVFHLQDSVPGPNAFGPNPKGIAGHAYGQPAPIGQYPSQYPGQYPPAQYPPQPGPYGQQYPPQQYPPG